MKICRQEKYFFLSSSLVTQTSLAQGRQMLAYKSRWGIYKQHSNRMIKAFLIAFLATFAAAEAQPRADEDSYLIYNGYTYTQWPQDEAEADPWLAYGYHGYGLRPYG